MAHTRLIHDAARNLSADVVAVFSAVLREEEKLEAFRDVYAVAKFHLDWLLFEMEREACRLSGTALTAAPPARGGAAGGPVELHTEEGD